MREILSIWTYRPKHSRFLRAWRRWKTGDVLCTLAKRIYVAKMSISSWYHPAKISNLNLNAATIFEYFPNMLSRIFCNTRKKYIRNILRIFCNKSLEYERCLSGYDYARWWMFFWCSCDITTACILKLLVWQIDPFDNDKEGNICVTIPCLMCSKYILRLASQPVMRCLVGPTICYKGTMNVLYN